MKQQNELNLISEMFDVDYITDNPDAAYDLITDLLAEINANQTEIALLKELIQPYHDIMISLNKENKKLHTKLSKYEK